MKEECCGTCNYHKNYTGTDDGWVCVNPDSDYYTDWTEYNDRCDEWEEK